MNEAKKNLLEKCYAGNGEAYVKALIAIGIVGNGNKEQVHEFQGANTMSS